MGRLPKSEPLKIVTKGLITWPRVKSYITHRKGRHGHHCLPLRFKPYQITQQRNAFHPRIKLQLHLNGERLTLQKDSNGRLLSAIKVHHQSASKLAGNIAKLQLARFKAKFSRSRQYRYQAKPYIHHIILSVFSRQWILLYNYRILIRTDVMKQKGVLTS